MTRRYAVGGFPDCGNAMSLPASQAARTWLSGLSQATAGQQVFLTPYGDTDVAALSHVGLDPDLIRAFADRKIGQQILRLPPASDDIAWPDGGLADSSVLGNLAVNRIKTVVLASSVMPPAGQPPSYTPSAQATAPSGIGTRLNVLLADDTITQILHSGGSASPGAAFATRQRFLAETAMIVAERPQLARSLVVAPPRRWNPAPGLAGDLLSETVHAPWLKPATPGGPGRGQAPHRAGAPQGAALAPGEQAGAQRVLPRSGREPRHGRQRAGQHPASRRFPVTWAPRWLPWSHRPGEAGTKRPASGRA